MTTFGWSMWRAALELPEEIYCGYGGDVNRRPGCDDGNHSDNTEPVPVLAFAEAPGHLIRVAHQAYIAAWNAEFRGQVTASQYAVASALMLEPAIDQKRLAELASLDKNTTVDLCRRLSARGWIERTLDPKDRRRRVIVPTEVLPIVLPGMQDGMQAVHKAFVAPLTDGDSDALVELLTRLAFQGEAVSVENSGDVSSLFTIGYLLRRVQQIYARIWAHVVPDLTGPQYAILVAIAMRPGSDQVGIAELAALEKSATAEIVSRLTRDAWVARRSHPRHARRAWLTLTGPAIDRMRLVPEQARQVHHEVFGSLANHELRQLIQSLRLVAS